MDLYLVRHGDTTLGPDGLYPEIAHLSETGQRQARALVPRLESIAPHVPITSGLLRADAPAAPFASSSWLQPIPVPGFDALPPAAPHRLRHGAVSAARVYELDRFGPCTPNRVQRLRGPRFLDSFTNQIFGLPLTPAPFMTSLSRGDAMKFSARLRVLKSW